MGEGEKRGEGLDKILWERGRREVRAWRRAFGRGGEERWAGLFERGRAIVQVVVVSSFCRVHLKLCGLC